ncbi:peptidase S8/S53 domain-containing protein [Lasiosphaeris hirsuta]|uniref:Peptidase S8/S53 domain-containing protein n=1 Tax=Lasiosphaeris hirsuta TaxID=260670 RepID=A0AA40AHZ2_9PEZI|nr:peptidase S8/S53 domain-containing protein [Lasiosphaeris hirsuta]
MEEQYPLFTLARNTFLWLSDQVNKIPKEKTNTKLSSLGGWLRIFAKKSLEISDAGKRRIEHAPSLEDILLQLETALSSLPLPDSGAKHAAKHNTTSAFSTRRLPVTPILDNIALARREAENDGQEGKQRLSALEDLAPSALSEANIDFDAIFLAFGYCSKISYEDHLELKETPVPDPSSEHRGLDSELDQFEQAALSPTSRPRSPTQVTIDETPIPAVMEPDAWLKGMTMLSLTLQNKAKSVPNVIPWKIAILDTGYDESVPAFAPPGRSSRIKEWKDLVGGSSHPVDTDGHGTHLLALLLQLRCPADIYVARVAENSRILGEPAKSAIAEAIRIAAKEWKVDFVSLPFGFSYPVEAIRNAIADAVYSKGGAITFFAAANNKGFNSNEMFPASLGAPVISVRATNRYGAFELKYNPPLCSDEAVFGTLGVDVVSDWPGKGVARSMSGCSIATIIATAIAVMLLEYAVANPKDFTSEDLRLMRTRRGVFEMFKEIGIHAGDRRYYVAPFIFFKLSEDVQTARLVSALARHPERR